MTNREPGEETLFESFSKRGLVITDDKERELHEQGYKSLLVSFEGAGILLLPFNKQSITNLFQALATEPGYSDYTLSKTHFLTMANLLRDQVLFFAMLRKRELPNATDALEVLDQAPWMERTGAFIEKNLP